MVAIRVATSEEFGKLLDALADEIVSAGWHFKLHKALSSASIEYHLEFGQSPTFWGLTFAAHLDASIARLCKIYDQNNVSLNLRNFLDTISQNLSLFDIAEFRVRLKDNPFVESLSQDPRKPDAAQLQADLSLVGNTNPAVKKLVVWRNTLVAHRSPKLTTGQLNLTVQYPISLTDVEALINNARSILNRYSSLFSASIQSSMLIGEDDFKTTLEAVRMDLDRRKRDLEIFLASQRAS
jgi:hypothetical protein